MPESAKVVEPMTEVDDAKMPLSAHSGDVVAAEVVPKTLVHTNGAAPLLVPVIAPHTSVPLELVVTAFEPEQVPKLPMVVEPVLETEKSVELIPAEVVEPMAKSVPKVVVEAAWIENSENSGEVEPRAG